ncbi:hypothetical protein ACFPTR_09350 [Aliibacillus thermotolerans]|uniref:Uncharacterized protein n=1 Tax=Aliibacillus thermotolerans TaxID=1834418 RepID=A0ABW0U7Z6_9BACI
MKEAFLWLLQRSEALERLAFGARQEKSGESRVAAISDGGAVKEAVLWLLQRSEALERLAFGARQRKAEESV